MDKKGTCGKAFLTVHTPCVQFFLEPQPILPSFHIIFAYYMLLLKNVFSSLWRREKKIGGTVYEILL